MAEAVYIPVIMSVIATPTFTGAILKWLIATIILFMDIK